MVVPDVGSIGLDRYQPQLCVALHCVRGATAYNVSVDAVQPCPAWTPERILDWFIVLAHCLRPGFTVCPKVAELLAVKLASPL